MKNNLRSVPLELAQIFFHSPLSPFPRVPHSANDPDKVSGEKKLFMKNSNSSTELLQFLIQELEIQLAELRQNYLQTERRIQAWIQILESVLKSE
jgi:hypothetical protein